MLRKLIKHSRIAAANWRHHRQGRCVICGHRGLFYAFDADDPKEMLLCLKCRSVSRQRLLARHLLKLQGIENAHSIKSASRQLAGLKVLDSSGNGPLSTFSGHSPNWVRGAFSENPASLAGGLTFVDLQAIPFDEDYFDVVISEDVLEHVPDPARALSEIRRVLRPEGIHLFTVPYNSLCPTLVRAQLIDGEVVHHADAAYHWDPEIRSECLVFNDFGIDFEDTVRQSGMSFECLRNTNLSSRGLLGNRSVFLSRKPKTSR